MNNTAVAKNRFGNKTILVTGGAGNIGKAVALRFSSEGANVIIADLKFEYTLVNEIEQQGGKAMCQVCDVTKEEDIADLIKKAVEKFGKIDYLFNNAGYQDTDFE